MLKTKLALFALLIPFFLLSQNNGIVTQNGRLQVNGNTIVNSNNQPFSTAGNSIYWSGFPAGIPFYQPEVISFLAEEWNSGIVRTAMAVEEANGAGLSVFSSSLPDDIINLRGNIDTSAEGYFRNPERELAKVRAIIDAAIGNDMYVIVDFHTHFAHLLQPEAEAFFTTIATEYGEYDNIIYEIFNEPIGLASFRSGANDSAAFSEFEETWDQIVRPYAVDLINVIRAIDPDNLIVVGTPGFDQAVVTASNDPLTTADLTQENINNGANLNVAYALHFYAGTHRQGLRNLAQQALNNDIALMVTEWGTVEASGDGAVDLNETLLWMDFLRTNNLSHANWSVTDLAEGASIVQPNTGTNGLFTNQLTPTGNLLRCIVENWDANTFGNCNTSNGGIAVGTPVKVEVETPVGQVDPNSGANSDFRSPGLSEATRADGEGILTGFRPGEAAAFRINDFQAGTNFSIEVELSSSSSGFQLLLQRNSGQTQLASRTVPDTGGLDNYQTLLFTGIPFDPNGTSDIALSIAGNGGGSINIESFTYRNGDLADPNEINDCSGITATFDDGVWTPQPPTLDDSVIINSDYDTETQGNLSACTLMINTNATITIADATHIQVRSNITVAGTLNIANEGSLVQIENTALVTRESGGQINVTKATPLLAGRDFIVLSSPMSSETSGGVYENADRVWQLIPTNFIPNTDPALDGVIGNFIDDNGDYLTNIALGPNNPINPMEGFLLFPQTPSAGNAINFTHTYSQGTLNNGLLIKEVTYNGPQTVNNFNLLGNPYPSAIDTREFIRLNSAIDAVYFWEHITTPNASFPGSYPVNHTMDDVSLFNLLGGIPAVNGSTTPGPFMSSGQGFGVFTNEDVNLSNIHFTNSMRELENNSTPRSAGSDRNVLWLRLDSKDFTLKSTAAIGFVPEATAGFDPGYDTHRLATSLSLFSNNPEGEQLAIQGIGTFNVDMEIPLGFSTSIEESQDYSISLDHFEGEGLEATTIFLIDNNTGDVTNLKEDVYNFSTAVTNQNNRFTVVFEENVLNLEEVTTADTFRLFPNPASQNITLSYAGVQKLKQATITSINGSIIKAYDLSDFNSSKVLDVSELSTGLYFIAIEGERSNEVKKVLIK